MDLQIVQKREKKIFLVQVNWELEKDLQNKIINNKSFKKNGDTIIIMEIKMILKLLERKKIKIREIK